jgi:hypothetical protein
MTVCELYSWQAYNNKKNHVGKRLNIESMVD